MAVRRYSFGDVRRLGLVLLLALFVGGSAADARHRPTDRIAFASFRDGNYEIYVMNADGSGPTRLTTTPLTDWYPAWSPDGTRIAFQRDQAALDLWVMNADGTGQTNLTNDGATATDSHAGWSPDGTKIVFRTNRDGGSDSEIWVMNADGSGGTQLTFNSGAEQRPSFSPDGTKIVFASDSDGDYDIYVMSATGGVATPLTDDAATDVSPAWSPDGNKVAFTSERDHINGEVYTMNANGENETRLTTNTNVDELPTWSPDGTAIAWDRDENIWVMDADGTDQLQLTTGGDDFGVAWAPQRPRLTVGKAGLGAGTVTGAGIGCGTDCTELYGYEAVVTLTAAALPGSRFTGWRGACVGARMTATCTLTMEATKVATASFERFISGYLCTIVGTNGRDRLGGTPNRDVICSLKGNDIVRGGGGNDVILLGDGNDTGYGGAGKDRVLGHEGRDLLVGGPQRDRLNGGPGRDRCLGRGDVKRAC